MTDEPHRPQRGRPRDTAKGAALLEAALAEFADRGLRGMTLESVAGRAGVSKVTLYRRWDSKNALVADILRALATSSELPDTGSLEGDLVALLDVAINAPDATRQATVFLRTMGEIATDDDLLASYRTHLLSPRLDQVRALIVRAQQRGEIDTGAPIEPIAALVAGPLMIYYLGLISQLDVSWPEDLPVTWARMLCAGITSPTDR